MIFQLPRRVIINWLTLDTHGPHLYDFDHHAEGEREGEDDEEEREEGDQMGADTRTLLTH
jgi:hypothetical protein